MLLSRIYRRNVSEVSFFFSIQKTEVADLDKELVLSKRAQSGTYFVIDLRQVCRIHCGGINNGPVKEGSEQHQLSVESLGCCPISREKKKKRKKKKEKERIGHLESTQKGGSLKYALHSAEF